MAQVPGVKPERLEEAKEVRHCALSLVGEPIMYPQINALIDLLHSNGVSTYLVTNAQFPEAIRTLDPVTQLYVSIDAATPETLKDVDRPLFADYWERLLRSLEELRRKDTRTVYRLTLINDRNSRQLCEYAKLVTRGQPHFIEVKGVTFCGDSKGSGISMQSVPYHKQVIEFSQQLVAAIDQEQGMAGRYRVACEHEHSCCVLIANVRYLAPDGTWRTHIDYARFNAAWRLWRQQRLGGAGKGAGEGGAGGGGGASGAAAAAAAAAAGGVANGSDLVRNTAATIDGMSPTLPTACTIDVMSYTLPTPSWALLGSREAGFDPGETRVANKARRPRPGGGGGFSAPQGTGTRSGFR
jgi:wyosine [tRNA(Phe)-imidazoG37] synthetase (radical SAM superfamily)